MSLQRHNPEPPGWEELLKALASDATPDLREEIKARLKVTTPTDEAVLGARDFLEDNEYDFDALRNFVFPPEQSADLPAADNREIPAIIYRTAAAAAILVAVAYGGWIFRTEYRHRQITEKIFYEPGLPVFAGLGGDRIFHEMMTSFRLKESAEGLKFIDTLERQYGRNDTLSYFAGWLHFFDKQYVDAARRFDEVARNRNSVYQEKSELMAAAAFQLVGIKEEARARLEAILKQSRHVYRKEAEELMRNSGYL